MYGEYIIEMVEGLNAYTRSEEERKKSGWSGWSGDFCDGLAPSTRRVGEGRKNLRPLGKARTACG